MTIPKSVAQGRNRFLLPLFVVVPILALDQLTKLWVRSNIPLGESRPLLGFVQLSHVRNAGIAFGLQANPALLIVATSLAALALGWLVFFRAPASRLIQVCLGLVLGGAMGNLVDRILFGQVTDFLDLRVWPVFNVADSAVVVGVGLLLYSLLLGKRPHPREG